MTVTIQKELAERITASPSTKDYSALSVWMVRFIGGYACEYLEGIWSVTARIDLIDKSEVDAEAELVGYAPFEVVDDAGYARFNTADGLEFWVLE